MGDDFSNRQCFVGEQPVQEIRSYIINTIVSELVSTGYSEIDTETEATRSLVIGPPGRWIFIGDTTGSTETNDSRAFTSLSLALSRVTPVIDVLMSDSAAVHLHLYKYGDLVDKYGNMAFPFYFFENKECAAEFEGNPELWAEYLVKPFNENDLRKIWCQVIVGTSDIQNRENNCEPYRILGETADMLGFDPDLCFTGYTIDFEGIGEKYSEHLHREDFAGFTELYFRD